MTKIDTLAGIVAVAPKNAIAIIGAIIDSRVLESGLQRHNSGKWRWGRLADMHS